MASFFTVPANWSFDKSDRYEKNHPGSAVNFGLRKAARQQGMGAYLYRYPGDWSMDRIEDEAARMKGGALKYEMGQIPGPYMPQQALPPDYKYSFRFIDLVSNQPLANKTVHVRIENAANDPKIGGWTSNLTTDANGVANIVMSGYGNATKYMSLTPKGAKDAIIWRFPINMTTGTPATIDIVNKPGGGLDKPDVVLGPSDWYSKVSASNMGTILGVGVLIVGVAFLGYQLYKGSKKGMPAVQPA